MLRWFGGLRRILPAFVTAALGSACGPASSRPAPPAAASPGPGAHGPGHGSGHGHGHADGHHGHGPGGGHHAFTDANAWAAVFDDPARDEWQHPDDILGALELAPSMTVADVGAGTGYFAVRLARAVPAGGVIATDVEPDMVRYLNERALREQLPNLRAVPATTTSSGLAARSVDRILVVDVWHHLEDRVGYARDLAAALRPGGRLFIVDFSLTARRGPPPDMRLAPESIVAELGKAGFTAKLSPVSLPDQYIVEAQRTP